MTMPGKLTVISDRIHSLDKPAYVKNSELRYVVANAAYCRLLGLDAATLAGHMTEDLPVSAERLDLAERERRCMVFGTDQLAPFFDPFGAGRFQVEIERFDDGDDGLYLFGVFEPMPAGRVAGKSGGSAAPASGGGLFDAMEIGYALFDRDERLVEVNASLQDLVGEQSGPLQPGLTLSEIVERSWRPSPGSVTDDLAGNRRQWIEERLALIRQGKTMDVVRLADGRWVQTINRRLPDGSLVCLRIDVSGEKERDRLIEKDVADARTLRAVLDESPVATFVRDRDHRLVFANQAYAGLIGKPVSGLIGSVEADIFGASAGEVADTNERLFRTGEHYTEAEDLTGADGRPISILTKVSRVTGDDGRPYLVGSMTDIADLRRREAELVAAHEEAEAMHRDVRDIVSSLEVGLIVLDADLNIEMVNDALCSSWQKYGGGLVFDPVGMSYRDMLGILQSHGNLGMDPATFEAFLDQRCADIRSGPIAQRELTIANGPVTLWSSRPLSSGKYLLSYVDITEIRALDRKVAEAHREAARALELARDATDTMPQGLMVIDGEAITFSNAALAPLLDVPADLVAPGSPWRALFRATSPGGDEAAQEERFARALAAGRSLDYDFPLAGQRWIRLQTRPNAEGHMVLLFTDLTQVRAREAELRDLVARAEAADRAKSEFLANMSHEIRTPMNGILGMAELLGKTRLDTRQRTFVDIVVKSGQALLTIINDVLDFSRLDAGQMQLRLTEFDPGEAVEDVASLLSSRASDKALELVVRRDSALAARVTGDAGRFRQIVTNLVGNAIKFTEQGHVLVRIGPAAGNPDMIELKVTDTGIGIPADKLGVIFEKFSQVDGSATRRHEGAGLGLAITAGLVGLHGGTIEVDSVPGEGSTFVVRLPMKAAGVKPRPQSLPVNVEGARILVIDDNEVNRTILGEQMAEWGFDAVAVESGEAGLAILEAAHDNGLPVDAVILDYHMPGANGADVARTIRADHRFDAVQLVFLTSMDIASDDQAFADLDVAAHLMKPARSDVLRQTLIGVLRAGFSRKAGEQAADDMAVPRSASDNRRPPIEAPVADRAEPVGSQSGKAPLVLIAEDNEVNQIVFRQILDGAGLLYKIVDDGQKVVESWVADQPALILMDVSMPEMSGLEATRAIRARERIFGNHVPIIGITAHALEGDADDCLAAGMDDYVAKPVSPERLEAKIRQWLPKGIRQAGGQG